jgi:hypothetical protein
MQDYLSSKSFTQCSDHYHLNVYFLTCLLANGRMLPIDNFYIAVSTAFGAGAFMPCGKTSMKTILLNDATAD